MVGKRLRANIALVERVIDRRELGAAAPTAPLGRRIWVLLQRLQRQPLFLGARATTSIR